MARSFSNTKLRVPKGFQSLLVGLSTEILRSQPRNIPVFAAEYFENLLQRREQEQFYLLDKQTNLEDRYYNNQSFQNEYLINDPDINNAATIIQAQYRGHKTRRDLEKLKQDEYQKSLFEEERLEQERAATSIQAQFRGFQVRKNLRELFGNTNEQEEEYDKTPTPSLNRFNDNQKYLTTHNKIEIGEKNDINRPHLERESTQLSEDFGRHTQISRDFNFNQEQQVDIFNEEDDMNEQNLDKAATRIQASYRGYKTRKELGTGLGSHGSHSNSGHNQHHSRKHDNTRNKNILSLSDKGNKVPSGEDDDHAAAVKIQAAYRGYRVRKDLEK